MTPGWTVELCVRGSTRCSWDSSIALLLSHPCERDEISILQSTLNALKSFHAIVELIYTSHWGSSPATKTAMSANAPFWLFFAALCSSFTAPVFALLRSCPYLPPFLAPIALQRFISSGLLPNGASKFSYSIFRYHIFSKTLFIFKTLIRLPADLF